MKLRSIMKKLKSIYFIFLTCILFTNFALAQQATDQQNAPDKRFLDQAKDGWRINDYKPYMSTLRDLEKLSKEYSEFLLKRSVDEYSKGFDTLEDMDAEIARLKDIYNNTKYLNEKWYWQEIDRKHAQEMNMHRIKIEAKTKSVTYFTRAINTLDEVRSNELKANETFIDYKSKLYRAYVSVQYDIGNIKPCIPILERYIALREENRKDIWAYRYLSSCYAVMEAQLDRSHKTNEEDVIYYKNKKNQSILIAVELQYGLESAEYKDIQKTIQKDESRREMINFNK
ncbi:MAG: hypothetical protein FWF73_01800 [Spirochaetes bacterium]|nr:hypothetical protein [Spirochaetota bacterium]